MKIGDNRMKFVAEILGVELCEFFEIEGYEGKYMIEEDGLAWSLDGRYNPDLLSKLLTGEVIIKREPFKPQKYEIYYWVGVDENIHSDQWLDITANYMFYAFGNCFRSEKEASANKYMILEKIYGRKENNKL